MMNKGKIFNPTFPEIQEGTVGKGRMCWHPRSPAYCLGSTAWRWEWEVKENEELGNQELDWGSVSSLLCNFELLNSLFWGSVSLLIKMRTWIKQLLWVEQF
jgi:hypothetical protein